MHFSVYTLLFAIIGFVATFLPWVYYPKGDTSLYGYVGDGLITGFVFFIISMFSLVEIFRKQQIRSFKIINTGLGLWMLWLAISNIFDLAHQKTHFETDNPFIGAAFAGFTQGIGLYFLAFGGMGVFMMSLVALYRFKANHELSGMRKWLIIAPLLVLALTVTVFWINQSGFTFQSAPNETALEQTFKRDIETMGQCLIDRDFDCFIQYNHPMIVQSYGSKEKMKELLNQAMRIYKDVQGEYKKVEYVGVRQTEKQGSNIQSIINQNVTMKSKSGDKTEHQQVLAISEDNGRSWHYINMSGMNKEKLSKFYPALNKNLQF